MPPNASEIVTKLDEEGAYVGEWVSPCPVCRQDAPLEPQFLPDKEYPDLTTNVRYVMAEHEATLANHPYIAHD